MEKLENGKKRKCFKKSKGERKARDENGKGREREKERETRLRRKRKVKVKKRAQPRVNSGLFPRDIWFKCCVRKSDIVISGDISKIERVILVK